MQLNLQPHPSSRAAAVKKVYVDLKVSQDFLDLWYVVQGSVSELEIPTPSESARADNLWKTTCFELFVRGGGKAYQEYNFSPSGEWAAYGFDSSRSGMKAIPVADEPIITVSQTPFGLETHVTLGLPLDIEATRIGVSAIIEEKTGSKSYWALVHPEGPPDFHHETCFAATLPSIGG